MNQLAKKQVCVLIRGGIELWIDEERVPDLEIAMRDTTKRLLRINGQLINPFEIMGVFTPDMVEEKNRRKNGQWKCMKNTWHEKGQTCECKEYKQTVTAFVEGVGEVTYKK